MNVDKFVSLLSSDEVDAATDAILNKIYGLSEEEAIYNGVTLNELGVFANVLKRLKEIRSRSYGLYVPAAEILRIRDNYSKETWEKCRKALVESYVSDLEAITEDIGRDIWKRRWHDVVGIGTAITENGLCAAALDGPLAELTTSIWE